MQIGIPPPPLLPLMLHHCDAVAEVPTPLLHDAPLFLSTKKEKQNRVAP